MLQLAEDPLAALFEYLRDRAAVPGLHKIVQVGEAPVQFCRNGLANSGFAGAHESNKSDYLGSRMCGLRRVVGRSSFIHCAAAGLRAKLLALLEADFTTKGKQIYGRRAPPESAGKRIGAADDERCVLRLKRKVALHATVCRTG